ncbi:MAG: hypothetical protein Q9183_005179 [Haloplaca sp. 2 TL-2023]
MEETEDKAQSTTPAKRPFDPEIEHSTSAAAVPTEQPSNLDVEPPLKRTRAHSGDIESPLGEYKIPQGHAPVQEEPLKASVAAALENTEPLVGLRATNQDNNGDDSDDSSIPEIDPTMDTDDEEDDEEEDV